MPIGSRTPLRAAARATLGTPGFDGCIESWAAGTRCLGRPFRPVRSGCGGRRTCAHENESPLRKTREMPFLSPGRRGSSRDADGTLSDSIVGAIARRRMAAATAPDQMPRQPPQPDHVASAGSRESPVTMSHPQLARECELLVTPLTGAPQRGSYLSQEAKCLVSLLIPSREQHITRTIAKATLRPGFWLQLSRKYPLQCFCDPKVRC